MPGSGRHKAGWEGRDVVLLFFPVFWSVFYFTLLGCKGHIYLVEGAISL